MSAVDPEQVSFYIPVRNAERTLSAAIESVRAQTVRPAEFFLVLDTRSRDRSERIARESGLRIVEQDEGRLGHARNLALRTCETPWLASCDSDVALEPSWLEALLEVAVGDVAAVGGCTNERLVTHADRWRAVNLPHNWGPAPFDNPFMLVSEMLAHVPTMRAVGGYRADLQSWEDSDACQRLRHAGHTLRYQPAAVAWHDRRDSVESVLDLRWFYASYRQRQRLESLPGLIEKFDVNRTYCLQSLSQTLHSAHADVCAVSLLLWFHHALHDLRAALRKWPLLSAAECGACCGALSRAMFARLTGPWDTFALSAPRLAPKTLEVLDLETPPGDRAGGLAATRGFGSYLEAARRATRDLLETIPHSLCDALLRSAEHLGGGASWMFEAPRLQASEADRGVLARQILARAWRWSALRETLKTTLGIDADRVRVDEVGPHLPEETPANGQAAGRSLLMLPHLEASPTPREALREALASTDCAVIGYRPPREFVAAVPILSARDLASTCAAQGFRIRGFQTEAGLTRLIVQRETAD